MMNSLLMHPGVPLIIASILILIFKGKANILSLGAILVSFVLLILFLPANNLEFIFLDYNFIFFDYSKLSFLFCLVFLLIALLGKIFSIYRDCYKEKALILLYIASSITVIFSGDFITLYIFWEIMAISSSMIIWSSGTKQASKAGIRYLQVHLFGGVILLMGIIGLYMDTGNLQIRHLDLYSWYNWLMLTGFLLNAGAPPFSHWLPDAYPEGSYSSTIFLSAYTTKTSVFILIMTFAGEEILIYFGLYMIMYGIIYALLENDIRRILSYSIVNQVGFMIVGIGIGTELAINGASAHAFSHIIYKGLLLMSAGSVIYMINKRKCTDVGGLYKTMPITATCGIIGALAISAFPLTSGFISKSMILDSSINQNLIYVWVLLLIGSAGVFLHAGIKFPWFVFFHRDKNIITTDPPMYMKLSMITASIICIGIGIFPAILYDILPFATNYVPYTGNHFISQLHLLIFSGLAFFISLKYLERTLTITLDFDWVYRDKGRYINKLVVLMQTLLNNLMLKMSLKNIKGKFLVFENYVMRQATVSVMVTLVLITLTVFLLLNII